MPKYRLINYFDVWGSKNDGWEVNNLAQFGDFIELADTDGETHVLHMLKEVGFLAKHIRCNMLRFELPGIDGLVEITQRKDGKPLCRLEPIQDWEAIPGLVKEVQKHVDNRPEDAPPPVSGYAQYGVYAIQYVDGQYMLFHGDSLVLTAETGFSWQAGYEAITGSDDTARIQPRYESTPDRVECNPTGLSTGIILAMNTLLGALGIRQTIPLPNVQDT